MDDIHLITGAEMPKADPESHLLVAALAELGATATMVPWRGPGSGSEEAGLAIVRTPWDYPAHREEFVAFCHRTARATPVHNPPDVIEWNGHKGYLAELSGRGIPVVPTVVVPAGADGLPEAAGDWPELVLKPAVSSGARGAGRFAAGDPTLDRHLRDLLAEGDVLVQPFAESVRDGERSLIFLGGELSHAVNKVPAAGDYRVQEYLGGTLAVHEPTDAECEVAEAAIAAAGAELLYARVDLVGIDGDPALMELEVIEPELFLGITPEAPRRLARAILARA